MGHAFWFSAILVVLGLLTACQKKEDSRSPDDWPEIISQMETILATSQPDSVKAARIQKLFAEHHKTLNDYRDFYQSITRGDIQKSYSFLLKVEKLLTHQIREESAHREAIEPNRMFPTAPKKFPELHRDKLKMPSGTKPTKDKK